MTQYYVGAKIVMAWAEEKDGKPGYAVKYEDGYTSWSPKAVFEEAYYATGNDREFTVGVLNAAKSAIVSAQQGPQPEKE